MICNMIKLYIKTIFIDFLFVQDYRNIIISKNAFKWSMVAYAYNLSTWKASAGESQIESQPRLQSSILPKKEKHLLSNLVYIIAQSFDK